MTMVMPRILDRLENLLDSDVPEGQDKRTTRFVPDRGMEPRGILEMTAPVSNGGRGTSPSA